MFAVFYKAKFGFYPVIHLTNVKIWVKAKFFIEKILRFGINNLSLYS